MTASTSDLENLQIEHVCHQVNFRGADITSLLDSPWCPSLIRILRLLADYFYSSPASPEAKQFVKAQMDRLNDSPASTLAPENSADSRRRQAFTDLTILEALWVHLAKFYKPGFVRPLSEMRIELMKLATGCQEGETAAGDAGKVAALGEDHPLFEEIVNDLEGVLFGAIVYVTESEEGKKLLSEIEASIGVTEVASSVRDEVDAAITKQLLVIGRQLLTSQQDPALKAEALEAQAVEHVLELMELALDDIREDEEVWSEIRAVCMEQDVQPARLQGILLATVHQALGQAFDVMPSEESLRESLQEELVSQQREQEIQ